MNNEAPNYSNNKDITIVTAFLDINRGCWKSAKRTTATYLESFYNYFNYDTRLIVFIDDKYINEIKEKYNGSKYKKTTFIPINIEWMEQNIYSWKCLEKCKNIIKIIPITDCVIRVAIQVYQKLICTNAVRR